MKLTALVVDDCAQMRDLLVQLLPLTGLAEFRFTQAVDGVEALARLRSGRYDIAFVDINMPKMTGMAFVRKARAMPSNSQIPIVMVTGETSLGKIEEALDEAGADVYITKPFTVADLKRQLSKLIEGMAARQEQRKARGPGFLTRLLGAG
jgi:two-component system chemotaxis response regulator CheY